MATETMTIWYEITDKKYVDELRKAADRLEKTGYAKLYLRNVTITDDPRGNDPADTPRTGAGAAPVGGGASYGGAGGTGYGIASLSNGRVTRPEFD